MNVGTFLVAIALVVAQLLAGLGGYGARSRNPTLGLALGLGAVALTLAAAWVSLVPYQAAAIAGGIVGVAAIVLPRAETLASWLAAGGTIAWIVAVTWLALDAAGVV